MSKESGLGMTTLSVDNAVPALKDIRNDITNFQLATPRAVQDVTGLDKYAMERILLLADFSITLNGVFNPDNDKSHDVLSSVATSNTIRTVSLVVSSQSLSNECLFTDYALTRDASGSLNWSAPAVLADGTVPTWT